jgi:hypothetical protein
VNWIKSERSPCSTAEDSRSSDDGRLVGRGRRRELLRNLVRAWRGKDWKKSENIGGKREKGLVV